MYFRKMSPRTTCLYSAASRVPRSLSAAAQRVASKLRSVFGLGVALAIPVILSWRGGVDYRRRFATLRFALAPPAAVIWVNRPSATHCMIDTIWLKVVRPPGVIPATPLSW